MAAKSKTAVSKTVKKMVVTKTTKKEVRRIARATAKKTAAPKAVRKQVKAIAQKLAKNSQKDQKSRARVDSELARLTKEMNNLKGKRNKKQLSEYNLFIRRQILDGKSFTQAVALWKKLRRVEEGKTTSPNNAKVKAELARLQKEMSNLKGKRNKKQLSEYNLFIRRQIVEGKTFTQAVTMWKSVKRFEEGKVPTKTRVRTVVQKIRVKSKPKVITKFRTRTKKVVVPGKTKTKYRTRTVVKRIKSKPQVVTKFKTRTKTVVRTVKSKPQIKYRDKIVEKPVYIDRAVEKLVHVPALSAPMEEMGDSRVETVSTVDKAFSSVVREQLGRDLALEELAYRMVKVYFEELARTGFKRQMSLDDLIDAFVYSWYRVEKQLGKKQQTVHHEENAYRIMHLYYIELARLGQKRTLSLDEMLDSYFYTLSRLGKDNTQLIAQMEAVRLQQAAGSTTTVVEKKTEITPTETTTTTTTVTDNL